MRKSPLAGSWYPGDKKKLTEVIQDLLKNTRLPELKGSPFGIISPHAGIQFSGQAAAYGFKALQNRKITRVILMGPSHYTSMTGLATSGVDAYETPLGSIKVDRAISDALYKLPLFQGPRNAEMPEHSLEMQLPFLQAVLGDFMLVPLVVGGMSPEDYEETAKALKKYVDAETIVVASSDFTHYGSRFGYLPFKDEVKKNLEKLDGDAMNKIIAKDLGGFLKYLDETGATICGCRPIGILMKMLPRAAQGKLLTYYTSGDLTGDYKDTVSYASIIFNLENKGEQAGK
ncbi:MAG: AmmeMemoRadiSam system protein B [Pseudomonadota bacterium]